MALAGVSWVLLLVITLVGGVRAEDPYQFFTWNVTYSTISPLGVPQQAILINGQFPGPNINSTTNNNIVINVFNNLKDPLLFTWMGIQQRKNSWQDGVLGTNCPIPPATNFTYHFQVKDQIGTYFYYPTTSVHRASGGFGGLRVNTRLLIPVPYPHPEDDYTVLIGDWYLHNHTHLANYLDTGRSLGTPHAILINGKSNPNNPIFWMKPGKTYKYRICNVGTKESLNFRIQGHPMKLVEMEGSHTVQNTYDSLDVHVGQCFSVLVTADKQPKDYYMVVYTRFTKHALTTKAIIRYTNAPPGLGSRADAVSRSKAGGWSWSLNQFRSFRWNLTANAARPNPQGSYHYGRIKITRTIKLVNSASRVNGKLRYSINGMSHVNPITPLKLAEYYGVSHKVFKYDAMVSGSGSRVAPNVLKQTYRNFVEIILENHEKRLQSWHLDGYSFFAVAVEGGRWSLEKRKSYNLVDAVSRHTIQVFPKSWAAILVSFDNAGMWNLRSEMTENRYLGQQMYLSVLSEARSLRDEYNIPDSALLCGIVKRLPKPPPYTI